MLDGIETELENNSLLKAVHDDSTIKLNLTPYEELVDYEAKHPPLTADQLLNPKPHVLKYIFHKYLTDTHDDEMHDFLTRVDYYERSHPGERWEKALDLYNTFFATSGAKLEKKFADKAGRGASPSVTRKSSRSLVKDKPAAGAVVPFGGPPTKVTSLGMVQLSLPGSGEEKGSRIRKPSPAAQAHAELALLGTMSATSSPAPTTTATTLATPAAAAAPSSSADTPTSSSSSTATATATSSTVATDSTVSAAASSASSASSTSTSTSSTIGAESSSNAAAPSTDAAASASASASTAAAAAPTESSTSSTVGAAPAATPAAAPAADAKDAKDEKEKEGTSSGTTASTHSRVHSRAPSRANSNFNLLGGGSAANSVVDKQKESKIERIDGVKDLVLELKHAVDGPTLPEITIFDPVLGKVKTHIQHKYIPEFKKSEHYKRYIQVEHYREKKVTQLDDFRQFRVLGRGSFGAVYAVQKIDTHAIYAMKEMDKRMVKDNNCEHMVVGEQMLLSKISTPFVLNLRYSFHDSQRLFLIFDMCSGGDLKYHMRRQDGKKFSNDRAKFYAAETLLGLEQIHSLDYVYRDLKPHNLLLTKTGHVKISDLGLALKLLPGKKHPFMAGTAGYWAPEIVTQTDTYKVSDFWSFGVFLYEMLNGKLPTCRCNLEKKADSTDWCTFGNNEQEELNALKKNGVCTIEVHYKKEFLSDDAIDLLKKLLEMDPVKRLGYNSIDEIKQHPYFSDIDWDRLGALQIEPPFVPSEDQVHAEEIADIGEFRRTRFNKIKVTAQEEAKWYEKFYFVSPDGLQDELVTALTKIDAKKAALKAKNKSEPGGGGCCVIQ